MAKKMAQVITRLDWSGSPDIVRSICAYLDPEEYDITLIYGTTSHPSEKTEEFLKTFHGKTIVVPSLKRDVSLFDDMSALVKLWLLFRRGRFDIVHTHTAKAGFIGRIAARSAGVPAVIHTPHGHNFYGYFGSLGSRLVMVLEWIAAFFADRIMVLTDVERVDMIRNGICRDSKITIIHSGIDLSGLDSVKADTAARKAELGIAPGDLMVGMISRLEPVKGVDYFIDAAAIISAVIPEARFLIVGEGSLREELSRRAERLKIADKVIFAGWREDIPEILPVLDILALTSLNEAVGRVILEAGACGKPVVATDVGGVSEVVKNGETGILVGPRDPQKIADAVIDLLKDGAKRRRMGDAARVWVKENFDEKMMLEHIHNMYTEILKA